MVDPDFAKQQFDLMLREGYLHPNGQMPAYKSNFGDVNGAGIGANHQTGWTGPVAVLIHAFGHYTAADNLSERRSYRSIRATAPLAKS